MAKATKKQALGRGLSALLKDTSVSDTFNDAVVGSIIEISLENIQVNPYQPRTYFDEESLRELARGLQSARADTRVDEGEAARQDEPLVATGSGRLGGAVAQRQRRRRHGRRNAACASRVAELGRLPAWRGRRVPRLPLRQRGAP